MYMLSRKDLNSAELETVRVSKSPTTVVAANGEVQTKEEATETAKKLDLFVTVKLLEDSPAVLSLGKLCQDHGYSFEWTSGQKPQLIKNGRRIKSSTENYVPIVVPCLSTTSSSSATPTSPTSVPQEAVVHASTRSESTSGTVWVSPARMVRRICGEILWMIVFQFTATHPRVLLVNQLQSREWKSYRANTVFILTSRRTETATSAWGPRWQGLLAEKRTGEAVLRAEKFGDLITADHKVLNGEGESRNNHRYAVVVQDFGNSIDSTLSVQNENFSGSRKELTKVLGADLKTKSHLHWQFLEFGKACEVFSWNDCTSTSHPSEANEIAGTSAVLLQSGLDEKRWADSMECYCNLRNIQDLLSDGKTPYERRFGEPFKGPVNPFGSMVEYHPISAKDLSRLYQFGRKVLPGIFLGYVFFAVGIWKGDILVADIEELEQMDSSEICAERLNAKEVLTTLVSGEQLTVKLSGGDQVLRKSSGRIRLAFTTTSRLIAGWWWSKKWFLVPFRELHLPSSRWSESKTVRADWRIIPDSTTIHWRDQSNKYDLGCDAWAPHRRLLEYPRKPRLIRFVDQIHTIHHVGWKPPDGYTWSGERLTKTQTTSRPDYLWPEIWKDMSEAAQRKGKRKRAIENLKLDNARRLRGIYFIDPVDAVFKETVHKCAEKVGSSDASSNALQDQEKNV